MGRTVGGARSVKIAIVALIPENVCVTYSIELQLRGLGLNRRCELMIVK